ncbi:MAG: proline iminopeptidase-family hydrolase [Saprospiraceae bacterium]
MRTILFTLLSLCVLVACQQTASEDLSTEVVSADDSLRQVKHNLPGARMIDLREGYRVWTHTVGDGKFKVLLLHGGPAMTHEYMQSIADILPDSGFTVIQYDQLGSFYSDQPADTSLWTIDRFVEEVEQVRQALGLDTSNFVLLGNSWGGILAMEYALKYQGHLKAMVVCNMTADFDRYEAYNVELRNELRPGLLDTFEYYESREDYLNPAYADLVFKEYYGRHICRLPEWPEPVLAAFSHVNYPVYEFMQGPSEFVPGGILKHWSVWNRLKEIHIPTLMVGARYDTMNPEDMEEMSHLVQHGSYLYCPNGSHMSFWDDQEAFFSGVTSFLRGLE